MLTQNSTLKKRINEKVQLTYKALQTALFKVQHKKKVFLALRTICWCSSLKQLALKTTHTLCYAALRHAQVDKVLSS